MNTSITISYVFIRDKKQLLFHPINLARD